MNRIMNGIGFGLIVVLGVTLLFSSVIIHYTTKEDVVFVVEDRERIVDSDRQSRYMIWADLGHRTEVFENTDTLLAFKFNSADLYGHMRVGYTCEATVNGFRIPFFSTNRNILSANCIESAD